jgi:hypothetical protein
MRGYGAAPARNGVRAKQARFRDDDEQEEPDERNGRVPVDDAVSQDGLNARQKQILKNHQLMTPMRVASSTPRVISHAIQSAIYTILDNPRLVPLKEDARDVLEDVVRHAQDEFTCIDPLVNISKTLSTGTCNIRLKETTPVSRLLIARALHCEYTIQLTSRMKNDPEPYTDNELEITPCRRTSNGRYALFGLGELNFEGMVDPELLLQVEAHMLSLGPLKPAEVCDPEWLAEQQEMVTALLTGQRVAMKPKPVHF